MDMGEDEAEVLAVDMGEDEAEVLAVDMGEDEESMNHDDAKQNFLKPLKKNRNNQRLKNSTGVTK